MKDTLEDKLEDKAEDKPEDKPEHNEAQQYSNKPTIFIKSSTTPSRRR
jgi:hypothetical protein